MTFDDPDRPSPLELFRTFAGAENTSYLLSGDLRILRVNEAWERFAENNGGAAMLTRWKRGSYILDAVPEVLRGFYRDLFAHARSGTKAVYHDYECSSDQVERMFRMAVFPLDAEILAVTHSVTVERGHNRIECHPSERYQHDGVIRMCSHCRRVRDGGDAERWDWVPAYVREPPLNISHGLCAPCALFYYAADSLAS